MDAPRARRHRTLRRCTPHAHSTAVRNDYRERTAALAHSRRHHRVAATAAQPPPLPHSRRSHTA
eukprot:2372298-Prymnesium_polylepis.1